MIIVPLGLSLAVRLVPGDVMADCRARAADMRGPRSRTAALVIVAIWLAAAGLAVWLVSEMVS